MELKYMPVGKVKMTPLQYWKKEAYKMKVACMVISSMAFLFGMCIGLMLA